MYSGNACVLRVSLIEGSLIFFKINDHISEIKMGSLINTFSCLIWRKGEGYSNIYNEEIMQLLLDPGTFLLG